MATRHPLSTPTPQTPTFTDRVVRIRQFCKRHRIFEMEVARSAGLWPELMSAMFSGKKPMSEAELRKIEAALARVGVRRGNALLTDVQQFNAARVVEMKAARRAKSSDTAGVSIATPEAADEGAGTTA